MYWIITLVIASAMYVIGRLQGRESEREKVFDAMLLKHRYLSNDDREVYVITPDEYYRLRALDALESAKL